MPDMSRRKVLALAPIAAAIAACRKKPPPTPDGRALVLVDSASGLRAVDIMLALERGDSTVYFNTDGSVPLEECVRVVWVPQGAEVRKMRERDDE